MQCCDELLLGVHSACAPSVDVSSLERCVQSIRSEEGVMRSAGRVRLLP